LTLREAHRTRAVTSAARALAALSESGQPAVLTYRQLAVDGIGTCPQVVWVCGNPGAVASAADRYGVAAPPLVCVNGQTGAAVVRLLARLGEDVLAFGDFDAGGISIARTLARRGPWLPLANDRSSTSGDETPLSFRRSEQARRTRSQSSREAEDDGPDDSSCDG
jgi:hypothetical protein